MHLHTDVHMVSPLYGALTDLGKLHSPIENVQQECLENVSTFLGMFQKVFYAIYSQSKTASMSIFPINIILPQEYIHVFQSMIIHYN